MRNSGIGPSTPLPSGARRAAPVAPAPAAAPSAPSPRQRASEASSGGAMGAVQRMWEQLPFVSRSGYPGVELPDFNPARAWTPKSKGMSGARANEVITKAYQTIDKGMSEYLGAPAIANWTTFGKYASREAGGDIVRFEAMLKAACNLDPASALALVEDFEAHPELLGKQGLTMLGLSHSAADFFHKITLMRDSLVFGNTAIMSDIGPAFDTFLRAVSSGQDGLAALKAAGYGKAPRDAQRFLLRGFEYYVTAKRLGDRLNADPRPNPAEAAKLDTQRKEAIFQANLMIAFQEQMLALQDAHAFGNPEVAQMIKVFSRDMALNDANGTLKLLPNGGNWADFATRMGLEVVPSGSNPQAFRITGVDQVTRDYVPNPDLAAREGTIYTYFQSNLDAVRSANLLQSSPSELPPYYSSWRARWDRWTRPVQHLLEWIFGKKPKPSPPRVRLGSELARLEA